jgi:hypothetical protein
MRKTDSPTNRFLPFHERRSLEPKREDAAENSSFARCVSRFVRPLPALPPAERLRRGRRREKMGSGGGGSPPASELDLLAAGLVARPARGNSRGGELALVAKSRGRSGNDSPSSPPFVDRAGDEVERGTEQGRGCGHAAAPPAVRAGARRKEGAAVVRAPVAVAARREEGAAVVRAPVASAGGGGPPGRGTGEPAANGWADGMSG